MADRRDPEGGWFSLDVVPSGEMPQRPVADPPSYSPFQLQPRQGKVITRALLVGTFNAPNWARLNPAIVWQGTNTAVTDLSISLLTAQTQAAVFTHAITDIQSGDILVKFTQRSYQKVNTDAGNLYVRAFLYKIDYATAGIAAPSIFGGTSTSNGALVTDEYLGDEEVNLDLYAYFIGVNILNKGGAYVPDDARALFVTYSYVTQGNR